MKIGLISDTHGSARDFQKVLDGPFKDVELILHAGDVLYHGAKNPLSDGYNTVSLAEKMNAVNVPVLIAKGNCDSDVDQLVLDMPIMSPYVFASIDGKRIMVVHGDNKKDAHFEELIKGFGLALLLHGHTHTPRVKAVGRSLIVNPGTPTIPGPSSPFKKTVGTLDLKTGKVAIHDIDTMNVVLEGSLGA
jgi:putative phosphoesterase